MCSGWGRNTRVAVILVYLHITLCDLEVVLGNDLVEGISSSSELLASVTMALSLLSVKSQVPMIQEHTRM